MRGGQDGWCAAGVRQMVFPARHPPAARVFAGRAPTSIATTALIAHFFETRNISPVPDDNTASWARCAASDLGGSARMGENYVSDLAQSEAEALRDVSMDRRLDRDRRGPERRQTDEPVEVERRQGTRRRVQRRRQIDPTTCERDYSADELEFMRALDAYKRSSGRMFPTCSEILEVIRGLGYVRTLPSEPESDSGLEGYAAEPS